VRRAVGLVVFLLAACSRAPKPPAGTADYASADGRFSARVPAAWRVDETRGEDRIAAFFGPGSGAEAEMISISYFPASSRWKTPLEFAMAQGIGARAEPIRHSSVAGSSALDFTVERTFDDQVRGRQSVRVRSLLVPVAGGFFALQDFTDAARASAGGEFDAFAASFRPGPVPK